ncbi:MAG: sulfotransferase [Methylococcales bacterium]
MNELKEKIIKNLCFYTKKALIYYRNLNYFIKPVTLIKPIFVVGCSRAGTTMIYKTFSQSKHLGSLHKETHDFWAELHPLNERLWNSHAIEPILANPTNKSKVSKYFYTKTGQTRIVDKNNQNGLSIPYLYQLFPDAHFIFIKRNAGDNIDSLIHGWGKSSEFATWSKDLTETIAIEQGKYQQWCFFLAEGWRQLTRASIEQVCAFQYRTMNEAILAAKTLIPQQQWHEVAYETLINQPVLEFEKLFQACNLPFDEAMKNHCAAVLETPYNTFSEIRVDKWKDGSNQEKISAILPQLADISLQLGY